MKTTVLLKLTLEGPDDLTEEQIQHQWLELVPVSVLLAGRRSIKIHGANIVAGGRNSDDQPYQLPVDKINVDGWRLKKHGQIGTPEVPRLMNHVVVHADPDGDEKLPFVLAQCEPDSLDGTRGKVWGLRRFRQANEVGSHIASLMAAECSDGKADEVTAVQYLAALREQQPTLSRAITGNKGDLFNLLTSFYHSLTGRISRTFHRHLCQTLFVDKGYEEDFTIQPDEFWRLLEPCCRSWFEEE